MASANIDPKNRPLTTHTHIHTDYVHELFGRRVITGSCLFIKGVGWRAHRAGIICMSAWPRGTFCQRRVKFFVSRAVSTKFSPPRWSLVHLAACRLVNCPLCVCVFKWVDEYFSRAGGESNGYEPLTRASTNSCGPKIQEALHCRPADRHPERKKEKETQSLTPAVLKISAPGTAHTSRCIITLLCAYYV